MKIVLCANHRAGFEALNLFITEEITYVSSLLIFTHKNKESARIIDECKKRNINFHVKNINEYEFEIAKFEPDIILSCYYRFILQEKILKLAKIGCLNIHPSLLPYYKGALSSPWAIINKEKYSGVSIHEMIERVDEGKIIVQQSIKLREDETAYSLYHRLVTLAIQLLPKALKLYMSGFKGNDQDIATDLSKLYFSRDLPYGGILNTNDTTYEEACIFIRAMFFPPYDGAKFKLNDGKVIEVSNFEEIQPFIKEFV